MPINNKHLLSDCYEFMLEHLMQYRIVRMAKVFGVSRSGFYYWVNHRHKVTQRSEHRKQLNSKVREVFANKKDERT